MTPMRVAASAGEARAMAGHGRNPLAGKDAEFGVILSDVKDEAPGGSAPATREGTPASPAPVRKPPPAVPVPLDVDALLARLATTGNPAPSAAKAPKARENMPKSSDEPGGGGEPGASDGFGANADASVVETLAATAASSVATSAAGAAAKQGGETGVTGPAARASAIVSTSATGKVPSPGDDPAPMEAAFASADVGIAGGAAAQKTSSVQVALAEVASHLTPARPASHPVPQDASDATSDATSDAASATADGPAKAKGAETSKPGEGAEGGADDGRADHAVSSAPVLSVDAAEAAADHPVRQIADAVATLAMEAPRPEAATAQAAAARPSPTRSLILHLAPATLGAITVRLHLTESGLSVRLAVQNPATLGLIGHSREALQAAIGATYKLDQLVIHGADTAPPPQAASHEPTRSDGGASTDQRSGGRRGHEESSREPGRQAPREARAAHAGRADGLFL